MTPVGVSRVAGYGGLYFHVVYLGGQSDGGNKVRLILILLVLRTLQKGEGCK